MSISRNRLVQSLVLAALVSAAAIAACSNVTGPDCKKGKPCGRTCIAKTDTCHIG